MEYDSEQSDYDEWCIRAEKQDEDAEAKCLLETYKDLAQSYQLMQQDPGNVAIFQASLQNVLERHRANAVKHLTQRLPLKCTIEDIEAHNTAKAMQQSLWQDHGWTAATAKCDVYECCGVPTTHPQGLPRCQRTDVGAVQRGVCDMQMSHSSLPNSSE